MRPTIFGSTVRKFSVVLSSVLLVCFLALPALAQRPGVPAPRPVPPPIRMPGPVVPHPPTFPAPVYHPSAPSVPFYTPRIPNVPAATVPYRAPYWPPFRPGHRPLPPVILMYNWPFLTGTPFWSNGCWGTACQFFWPYVTTYPAYSSPGPTNYVLQSSQNPVYVYGQERPDFPQLFMKDGSVLNVSDYWVVDNQLHFKLVQGDGTKPEEQVIPFDELDLQKTVDANTQRGFRFVLRNEPFEQYVRDHPEGPPPAITPRHD